MEELFVPVIGFEGVYEISNFGNIRSLTRLVKTKKGHYQTHNGKAYIPHDNGMGYKFLRLYKNNKGHHRYIHRLVATHFIDNPENKKYVNHIDGIKSNNRVDNLEWCTAVENMAHAYSTGLSVKGNAGKKVKQLSVTGELIAIYPSVLNASKVTGISRASIADLVVKNPKLRWERKTAGGFRWEYCTD